MNKAILLLLALSLNAWSQRELPIIKIGNPVLRATALEVDLKELQTPEFQQSIDDMIHTMKKASGVGLAAPQVNKSIRMFVMKSFPKVPLTVVINPKIEYLEHEGMKNSVEGCLSIPGKQYRLQRYKKIHLTYYNRKGEFISKELKDFGAIIAQHEYDHLNGVLIVDFIQELLSSMNYFGYVDAPLM